MDRSSLYISLIVTLFAGTMACSNTMGHTQGLGSGVSSGSTGGGDTGGTTDGGSTAGGGTAGGSTAGSSTAGGNTAVNPNGSIAALPAQNANPFTGAAMYVNPDYAAEVTAATAGAAAADAAAIATVKAQPTAVWLDRIDAIAGGALNSNRLSLTGHLDAAVQQAAAAGKPGLVLLVVYDLPNRDCKSQASNGELQGTAGLADYKTKYIDVIAQTLASKPAYANLRIVTVIEPDSIPNLVTNQNIPACATAISSGVYVDGVTYAIQKLSALPNVYMYMDIAHAGWLGWPAQMASAVTQYMTLINKATGNKPGLIRGFATDIANYTPVQEPFLNPNDQAVLSDNFYQYNPCFDEVTFVRNLAAGFKAAGMTDIGFITDTSRSGWNPTNTGQPIDQRKARGNWCNVIGAGIGELPQASPSIEPLMDAFVWVKPPGESDGFSALQNPANTPDAQGKRFDPDCDSTNAAKDAMPSAPSAGSWFGDAFTSLLHNAHPALK